MQDDFDKTVQELKRVNQDMHKKEIEEDEAEVFVDKLVEVIRNVMPETIYLVKNKERYDEAMDALQEFIDMVREDDKEAKITIKPDELFGTSLCCEIECTIFEVTKMEKFCKALKVASSFEICALTNGNVSIGIGYDNAYKLVPPRT